MECSEVKQHLSAYHDGELPNEIAEEVKLALVDCPDCQQELEELALLSELARDGFESPVENIDFSKLTDQVMARIHSEQSATAVEGVKVERREEEAEGFFDTISNFFGELLRFERPMAAIATAALVVLMVVGLQDSGLETGPEPGTDKAQVAQGESSSTQQRVAEATKSAPDKTTPSATPSPTAIAKKKNRRQRALEEPAGSRDMAAIESSRAPAGVRIDIDQDQGRPAIVWHVDEDSEDAPN